LRLRRTVVRITYLCERKYFPGPTRAARLGCAYAEHYIWATVDKSLQTWFKQEILVHEGALMRFLRRSWRRDAEEVRDLRQEVYVRVFEAAAKSRPMQPKAFLFTTAKNLLTDHIRRQRVVTIDTVGDLESLNTMVDDLSPERRTSSRQDLRLLAVAFDALPPRCRTVVWLRKVEQLPQKEVAARLGVTQKMIEKHVKLGMRRLADALFGNELVNLEQGESQNIESDRWHGQQQTD
jgi:RNA polymerase sigma factor (sigma-70 family)